MKLLLLEDVDKLGSLGDEVSVKDGYGRNFLIPKGKAVLASTNNVKQFSHQKGIIDRKLKKLKGGAEAVAEALGKLKISVTKKVGDQGKLFGSVTSQEIGELIHAQGVEIDRRKIQMSDPIKTLGEHKISIKLHPEVMGEVTVTVAAEAVPEPDAAKEEAPAEEAKAEETKE